MIDGVKFFPLSVIPDSRGAIFHFMKKDLPLFKDFDVQEVYFSLIYPGVIKGWHRHHKMTLNYVVPIGHIKLVLWDDRKFSPTMYESQELYLGPTSYKIVRIPPMVWNGFMAVGNQPALVANATNLIHDPDEIDRISPKNFASCGFEYDWFESNQG